MRSLVISVAMAASAGLLTAGAPAVAEAGPAAAATVGVAPRTPQWVLSRGTLPVGKDRAIGLKLDRHQVMWVGGLADDPTDNNRCFIYDTRSRTFRETARIPAAKPMDQLVTAGVLSDGTVVVAGGALDDQAGGPLNVRNRLSYRYDPRIDSWTRTGDLPEPQEWLFVPATLLKDGRLLLAGGMGLDGLPTGTASLKGFVYNAAQKARVDVIDPNTGDMTGANAVVQGKWDYTRTADGRVSTQTSGHMFGNSVLLKDGRVFVGGGHTTWDWRNTDTSFLASGTDFFNPATGVWSSGTPFPAIPGEDGRINNSHGGRTNGVGFAVLDDGNVVIAGGFSANDGESYFGTTIGRRSILIMSPATNPLKNRYRVSPNPIPPGTNFGGFLGDGGRGQALSYAISRNRVVIAGGMDNAGGDLFDTYIFDDRDSSVARGPDLAHEVALWAAQHPEWGYPQDYQTATISTLGVSMNNSKLVFDHDVLVHGGGYNGIGSDDFLGSRYVEQLTID